MIIGLFTHDVVMVDGKELFAYSLTSIVSGVLGSMLFAGSLVLVVLGTSSLDLISKLQLEGGSDESEPQRYTESIEEEQVRESNLENDRALDIELVLHLLSGDDRVVFRMLVDSGGTMFQKDLVNQTQMSDAKVSRVLDRLEAKDLVIRERRGMSNRIAIKASK